MVDTLRSRIIASFLILVVGVGAVVLPLVLAAMRESVIEQATAQVQVGRSVVVRELQDRARQLQRSATVLVHDFGFKQALATRDEPTIRGAILNQGHRIDADLVAVLDAGGTIDLAISDLGTSPVEDRFPFPRMTSEADRLGSSIATRRYGDAAYQIVVLPVLAPERVGWALLGFRIDEVLLDGLAKLAGTELALLEMTVEGEPLILATTLADRTVTARMGAILASGPGGIDLVEVGPSEYLSQHAPLAEDAVADLRVLLAKPLAEALAPYERLRLEVFVIIALACLVAAAVGVFLARSVSDPLSRLVQAAGRVGRGEYFQAAPDRGVREVRTLAGSFNKMQDAIAEREAHILHQAHHDSLTNLSNRLVATERIEEQLAEDDLPFAIILIDLNRFKQINDTLGHGIGDELLVTMGDRLRNAAREGDLVARLGGDEFLLILGSGGREDATSVAERIVSSVARKFQVRDIYLSTDVSVGIALAPEHGRDAETLLRRADIAMYDAKASGSAWAFYRPGEDERHLYQLSLINDLRDAITVGALAVHYQPKVRLIDGDDLAVEALVRWDHPRHGAISPGEFIPLAEQSGIVSDLTDWVLREVAGQLARWEQEDIRIHAAINISAMDLLDVGLAERITETLADHGLAGDRLTIEVTESAIMADIDRATEILAELRRRGVRVSIDDFGTGQSSLAQLKRLPVDELKIDRSFVRNIHADDDDRVIVESTVALGHRMGLQIVAEGIETAEGRNLVAALGCDMGQGYLISKPLSAADFTAWIREQAGAVA